VFNIWAMDEPTDSSERRDETRAPIELKVEYKRLNAFFADYTKNISRGGTFIATMKPLPVGTEFLFRLEVPGLPAPLELRGIVRWLVEEPDATDDQAAGMGIRFLFRDDHERDGVERLVERLMVDSLGRLVYAKLIGSRGRPTGEEE
jgi:type IV pilus assembly protein PilZ